MEHEKTILRGALVVSADGKVLGSVDETRPEHFQTKVEGGQDFWLERRRVTHAGPDRVEVDFAEGDLAEWRLSDPGAVGAVGATSTQPAYIRGATPEDANELFDPSTASQ